MSAKIVRAPSSSSRPIVWTPCAAARKTRSNGSSESDIASACEILRDGSCRVAVAARYRAIQPRRRPTENRVASAKQTVGVFPPAACRQRIFSSRRPVISTAMRRTSISASCSRATSACLPRNRKSCGSRTKSPSSSSAMTGSKRQTDRPRPPRGYLPGARNHADQEISERRRPGRDRHRRTLAHQFHGSRGRSGHVRRCASASIGSSPARMRTPRTSRCCSGGPHVRLAPLYDVASILPYDEFDMHKVKLAMKIGGEYKLSQIGLRQWQKFAREMRLDADELVERLSSMAKQLPDEANAARRRAGEEGLDDAIIERLATQLIERADECRRVARRRIVETRAHPWLLTTPDNLARPHPEM